MNEANIYLVDNGTLQEIKIIDRFISFIWTDRYNEYGDFELVIPEEDFDPNLYKKDRLITVDDNDRYMIIETIVKDETKESSRENKITYTIKGRGVETLLERRVVEKPFFVNTSGESTAGGYRNISNDINGLIYSYFYNNDEPSFRTKVFEYKKATDPYPGGGTYGQHNNLPSNLLYKGKSVGSEYMGQTVGEAVWDLCKYVEPIEDWPTSWTGKWPDESDSGIKKFNLAIRAYKDQVYQNNTYIDKIFMVLYSGVDRSYSQTTRPVVEFSEYMDNIGGYSYSESDVDWKNAAVIRGNFLIQHKIPKMNNDGTVQKDSNGNVIYDTYIDENGTERYRYDYEDNYIYTTIKTNPPNEGWGTTSDMTNIDYRCLFLDSDVERRKMDENFNLTDELYTYDEFVSKMKQRGFEALYEYQSKPDYSVELLDYGNYRYGRDYFIGDIVAVKLSNGKIINARIIEVIRSWDNTGYSIYPSFELIQD